MGGPDDTFGFSLLIGQVAQSGQELTAPEVVFVRPTDFKAKQMTTTDLKILARKVRALAYDRALSLSHSELSATVKNYLRSIGWSESR
jgi:hypothetical protein